MSESNYLAMLREIVTRGESHDDRTGVGTYRIFGHQLRFDLKAGFPLLTTKLVSFRNVAEELLWMIRGDTSNASLQKQNVTIWNEWATAEKCASFGRAENDLGPIYGHQWRNFGASENKQTLFVPSAVDDANLRVITPGYNDDGVDQLRWVVDEIMSGNKRTARRLIVSGWNPREVNKVALPPCHTLYQFGVLNGALNCHMFQRSADCFLGVPYNIASYALLTHMVALVCGLEVGDLVISLTDAHIYKNHLHQVLEQIRREPRPFPTLTIAQKFWGTGFAGLLEIDQVYFNLADYKPHPPIRAEVAV